MKTFCNRIFCNSIWIIPFSMRDKSSFMLFITLCYWVYFQDSWLSTVCVLILIWHISKIGRWSTISWLHLTSSFNFFIFTSLRRLTFLQLPNPFCFSLGKFFIFCYFIHLFIITYLLRILILTCLNIKTWFLPFSVAF